MVIHIATSSYNSVCNRNATAYPTPLLSCTGSGRGAGGGLDVNPKPLDPYMPALSSMRISPRWKSIHIQGIWTRREDGGVSGSWGKLPILQNP